MRKRILREVGPEARGDIARVILFLGASDDAKKYSWRAIHSLGDSWKLSVESKQNYAGGIAQPENL